VLVVFEYRGVWGVVGSLMVKEDTRNKKKEKVDYSRG
jgi:hypothetical protein